jgi:hypothetical protein
MAPELTEVIDGSRAAYRGPRAGWAPSVGLACGAVSG